MSSWKALILMTVAVVSGLAPLLVAQSPVILGESYRSPIHNGLALGQVITLYVQATVGPFTPINLKADLVGGRLPRSLGDVTVRFGVSRPEVDGAIFSVETLPLCPSGSSLETCTPVYAITVQVPYELGRLQPLRYGDYFSAWVGIKGVLSGRTLWGLRQASPRFLGECGAACLPALFHGDGTVVSERAPAKAGETLIVYAYGLGLTAPEVPTGERAPTAPLAVSIGATYNFLYLDYRPDSRSRQNPPPASQLEFYPHLKAVEPTFVGLSPGSIGLYQINFQLPPAPVKIPECLPTNVTIGLGDGISFCMETSKGLP